MLPEELGLPDLAIFGAILDIDRDAINVLGRQFELSGLNLAPIVTVADLGKSAYVEAIREPDGQYRVTKLDVVDDISVPGASYVFVQGVVEAVDDTGHATVAGLSIDMNSLGPQAVVAGTRVAVTGVQPVPGGVILADWQAAL